MNWGGIQHGGKGRFEPQVIKKNQTGITQKDCKTPSLYIKEIITREMGYTVKEMHNAEVSLTDFKVTDAIKQTSSSVATPIVEKF